MFALIIENVPADDRAHTAATPAWCSVDAPQRAATVLQEV